MPASSDDDVDAADFEVWRRQYLANVVEDKAFSLAKRSKQTEKADVFGSDGFESFGNLTDDDLLSEIDSMNPTERQYLMEELAIRSEFWDESEVVYE